MTNQCQGPICLRAKEAVSAHSSDATFFALSAWSTSSTNPPIEIKDQLRQGSAKELYDYVFLLGYLSPIYNLQWDGEGLEQLSPSERGNLLLIFYLLVDQDDIPLVIDQSEENLDNQTVFRTLVPCIKDAKKTPSNYHGDAQPHSCGGLRR